MRPFSTLGVKPFLQLDPTALAALQTEFHRRSRLYHPDRFLNASDEERARAESQSAELNSDYARLRDPLKLVDTVLSDESVPPSRTSSAPPPELAEEYFELQEAWMEGGPEAKGAAEKFLASVQSYAGQARTELERITTQFPFRGLGDSPAPWTQEDLEMLRKAVHKLRYSASFERDIRTKFLGG